MAFDPDKYLAKNVDVNSSFDPDAYLEKSEGKDQSFMSKVGEGALDAAVKAGRFIDTYTGAPVRSAISAAQHTENPLSAFADQFGKDPSLAPTGKEIAQYAGVPDTSLSEVFPSLYTDDPEKAKEWLKFKKGGAADISASGAAGLGIDFAGDVTTLIPPAKAAKLAAKGVRAGSKAVKPSLSKLGSAIDDAAKGVTAKVGGSLTGLNKKAVRTYADKTDEVNKMIKESAGDVTDMSDSLRGRLQGGVRQAKDSLGAQVDEAVKKMPTDKNIDVSDILDTFVKYEKRLDPSLEKSKLKHLQDLSDDFMGFAKDGKMSYQDLHKLKRVMQERAKYAKDGTIFTNAKEVQDAAKEVAHWARRKLNKASKEYADANLKLSKIHNLEKKMNKNLLAPDKPDASLIAAGLGTNPRNAKHLKSLSELSGMDAIGEAEKLAAAREFSDAKFFPKDTTGKAAARMLGAGSVGYATGGPLGAMLSTVFTSPATLKAAINAGKISKGFVKKIAGGVGELTDDDMLRAIDKINSPQGRKNLESLRGAANISRSGAIQKYKNVAEGDPGQDSDSDEMFAQSDRLKQIKKLMPEDMRKRMFLEGN